MFNRKGARAQGSRREMGFDQGGGRGLGGGLARGPGGECVCPSCGHREKHQRGVTCITQICPKCGSLMTRA